MEGHLTMSAKERRRLAACERVRDGTLSVTQAAALLSISVRQMRRSFRRYETADEPGLLHAARGRVSNRKYPDELRDAVLERYQARYEDFGPTLAAEKLADEGLVVDHETLRRWLATAGLRRPRPRRATHRCARERMHHFGELVQFDGSPHDWFEGRREACCLMQMIDDATGVRMGHFCEQESTADALRLLRGWIVSHGVPAALYTDRKNVYVTGREPTLDEQLAGVEPTTAFGAACARLGIAIIPAASPQAKGRIERANGVAQDRLVKELRLAGISTIEAANELLACGFMDSLNARFAVSAADATDFHRPLVPAEDLDTVLAIQERRCVTNDYTIRHRRRILQIAKQPGLPRPKQCVTVVVRLDGTIHIEFRGNKLLFEDVTERVIAPPAQPKQPVLPVPPLPGPDHPWRRGLPPMPTPAVLGALANSQDRTFLTSR